ncbi:hypothetical protein [Methylocystis sp. B8]|uniref:hypothetical protein n=1 Tax=Methylocystis sp. B8 TaxID=544938 RepID=UPI0010FF2C1E|nr:hypothetical protein [Methylocystis sp. B8]TLG75156.1 hypothetical protein FEV16_11650 [Methylocystis sp. B8]
MDGLADAAQTVDALYEASPIRRRSTKSEVGARRDALLAIVSAGKPMTVRLRAIVESAITMHLPHDQFDVLKAAEASEREHFMKIAEMLGGSPS